MPEPTADGPSVMDQAGVPVATPPKPAAAETDDPAALKAKLDLVKQDNLAKGEANARLNEQLSELQRQLKELQSNVQSGKHKQLEDSGEYKVLVAELRETIKGKDAELEALRQQVVNSAQAAQDAEMKLAAYSCISDARPNSTDDLYELLQPRLRKSDAGKPVVLNGGVEIPLAQYLTELKKPGSGREYLFQPNGVRGMNSAGYAPSGAETAGMQENPFKPGGNITQRLLIEVQNPDLAAQLKAEAGAG